MAQDLPVQLRVLGPLEVLGDEGPVAIAAQKHRRLLAALAIAHRRQRSADELIDAVWGEAPPPSARKVLQVYVSKLRRSLPKGAEIETTPTGYRLALEPDALDAEQFERLLDEGRSALRDGNSTLAASLLGRALSLWRGRAYADVAYDDFARAEAERLEELRLVAVEEHIDAQLQSGGHAEVLAEVRALAAGHPLRERLQAQLMTALYRDGRQAEALEEYRLFRERLGAELGLDPGPELTELQRRILAQDASLLAQSVPAPRAAVPVPPTALLGRDPELSQLLGLLGRPDVRLLVLTGAGGAGKTRLALEAARVAGPSFANGAAFVELAPIRDQELVPVAIAHALGIAETPGQALADTLAIALRPQELLLVVDNAEQVPDAAPLFVRLVAQAPRIKVVVTSRRVLHVSGEIVFPVPPLDERDAVELFADRARALDPSFSLDGETTPFVHEICRRLDGLPLAIELAAARTNTLSPRALSERLANRLTILTSGPHDLPARQQTLADTIAWSVDLLDEREREAFARTSVFAGAWTLEAAEAVCAIDLDTVAALVDHSLIRKRGADRFVTPDVLREFARQLLDDETRRKHALYALETAEASEGHLTGPDQRGWMARLEAEHDEIRVAQQWFAHRAEPELELRLASAIGRFRYVRGYLAEGRARLEEALRRGATAPPELRAKACRVGSAICVLQGDWTRARELSETGLALYEDAGDRAGVARSLSNLGAILLGAGDDATAARTLDRAIALAREMQDSRILALVLNNRGDAALTQHDFDAAVSLFEESLQLFRVLGDEANIVRSLFNLGAAMLESGRTDEARELLVDSLRRSVQLDDKEDTAWCLIALAAVSDRGGRSGTGATLLGAAEQILADIGAKMKPYERDLHRRIMGELVAKLGDQTLHSIRSAACEMPLDAVLKLAYGGSLGS